MQQYECVFDNINCSFAASVLIHRDSCYALLAPLNLSENQIRALLEEQDSEKVREAWRDAELQKKLVKRLGMNCKTYLSFLDKLNRRILLLAHKLKLGPTFMVSCWISYRVRSLTLYTATLGAKRWNY